tara:strand:- start:6895 stop:7587 length:693 start_codon:yes stop_codon:yes gene_type:complete
MIKTHLSEVSGKTRIAVQADVQSSGRGRHGREWVSPEGNLFATIAFRPERKLAELGLYAYVTALALYDAVLHYDAGRAAQVALKWPNDLMVNDQKAAGILMEHYSHQGGDYLLIGLGVNLASAPEGKSVLAQCFGGVEIESCDFLKTFLTTFDVWDQRLSSGGAGEVTAAWQDKAWRLEQSITAKLGDKRYQGKFDSIDDIGSMIIQLENGTKRRITAGQLYFGDETDDN